MRPMYILHLSDLHADAESQVVLDEMTLSLVTRVKEFLRARAQDSMDLLVVSGDLVSRGAKAFDLVGECLDQIADAIGVGRDRIFMVPGNHEVDRDLCSGNDYEETVRALRRNYKEFIPIAGDDSRRALLTRPFTNYTDFAKRFPLVRHHDQFDLPGFSFADVELPFASLRLCGVNSALVAGPLDAGTSGVFEDRCLGMPYLSKMLDRSKRRLNLVVSHYPLSWIQQEERDFARQVLRSVNAVLLTGHLHADTNRAEIVADRSLLELGVGAGYGERWNGRNHCRVVELDPARDELLLHDWIWHADYGWRPFEAVAAECSGWKEHRRGLSPVATNRQQLPPELRRLGLVHMASSRSDPERTASIELVLHDALKGSEIIVMGRSLFDWASYSDQIERAINERGLSVRLALLDEAAAINESGGDKSHGTLECAIEAPIQHDWAFRDVPRSMERFRSIKVDERSGGSLHVYGLPFYLPRTFVAYTSQQDGRRYCMEEVGMARHREGRPFLHLARPEASESAPSYAESLEDMYAQMLTDERVVLAAGADASTVGAAAARPLAVAYKAKRLGLVDLAIGRDSSDWHLIRGLRELVALTPDGGEIFMVGRSLVAWSEHRAHLDLAKAVVERGVRCTLVSADFTRPDLKSLVDGDYAAEDLERWPGMLSALREKIDGSEKQVKGTLDIVGIPAYLPVSFSSLEVHKAGQIERYCALEPGIAVLPHERPVLYFSGAGAVDDSVDDPMNPKRFVGGSMFARLNAIYRNIVFARSEGARLLYSSRAEVAEPCGWARGHAWEDSLSNGGGGWFVGAFIEEPLRHAGEVEVKWGEHRRGASREPGGERLTATTLTILINGEFVLELPDGGGDQTLTRPGEYVVFGPGLRHSWRALTDSTVLTVRWPSVGV